MILTLNMVCSRSMPTDNLDPILISKETMISSQKSKTTGTYMDLEGIRDENLRDWVDLKSTGCA